MRRKIYKKVVALLVVLGVLGVSTMTNATTSEEVVELSREDAIRMAIENSSDIRDLELGLEELISTHSSTMERVSGLEELYDIYPYYEELYEKNQFTYSNPAYINYLEYQKMIMTAQTTTDAAIYTTSAAAIGLSDSEIDNILTVQEEAQFGALRQSFMMINVNKPLSALEEYDTFIYPIEVGPIAMQMGIQSMDVGVDVAKAGISSGVMKLYDGVLAIEDGLAILEQSYEVAKENYETMESKYTKGLVSEMAVEQAKNDYEIAELEKNKMVREVDNLKMSFNQLIGLGMSVNVVLEDDLTYSDEVKPLEDYIEEALMNRNELLTLEDSIVTKEVEFEVVEEHFSISAETFKIADAELKSLYRQVEETEIDIELEIREAYIDVMSKKDAMDLAKKELEDINSDYAELEKYYDLGMMAYSNLNSYKMLVIQKENAYKSAIRTYNNALTNLEGACSIGPSYS